MYEPNHILEKKLSNKKITCDFVQKSMYDEETHGRYHNEEWIQVRNIRNNVSVKISHKNKKNTQPNFWKWAKTIYKNKPTSIRNFLLGSKLFYSIFLYEKKHKIVL